MVNTFTAFILAVQELEMNVYFNCVWQ